MGAIGSGEEDGGENGDGESGEEIEDEWFGGDGHGGQLEQSLERVTLPHVCLM